MITLLGATGYTGRLVAHALDRGGLPYRLAGRSPDRLARLAEALPARPTWLVADATRPESLPPLFADSRLIVNCAGPFTDLGEPVVAQAALHGTRYLDTTNELGYVYRLRGYEMLARQSGAAIVPACGFEVALADCAAAVAAAGLPAPLDEVSVVYELRGLAPGQSRGQGSSLGTRRSAVRALATSWLAYRGGRWQRALPAGRLRRVQVGDRRRPAVSFPSGETVTVPGHLAVGRVDTWLAASWHALFWAPVLLPVFAWLAAGPVGRLVDDLIGQVSPPPGAGLRSQAGFAIQVTARRGEKARRVVLRGQGVYDLTAEIVAYAAARLMGAEVKRGGVLPPAVALDPRALLDEAVARWGVTVDEGEA